MRTIEVGDYVGIPNHINVIELMPNKHLKLRCLLDQIDYISRENIYDIESFDFYVPMDMEGLDMEIANSYILPEFSLSELKHERIAVIQDVIQCHFVSGNPEDDLYNDFEYYIYEQTPYSESMGIYFQVNAIVHPVNTAKLRKGLYASALVEKLSEELKDLLEEWVEQGDRLSGIFSEKNAMKRYQAMLSRSDKYQHYPNEANAYIKYSRAKLKLYHKNKEKLEDLKSRLISKELFSGIVTDIMNNEKACVLLDNKKNHIVFNSKDLINFNKEKQLKLDLKSLIF